MAQRIIRKGTLLIKTGAVHHLHIVCNDPVLYPRLARAAFLCVNVSSVPTGIGFDTTCLLNTGDHSFIRHASFVYYDRAAIFGEETVLAQLDSGDIVAHELVSDALFSRLLDGFEKSRFVAPKIRHFYLKFCKG
jgi:hypothetical protein